MRSEWFVNKLILLFINLNETDSQSLKLFPKNRILEGNEILFGNII